MLKPLNPLKFLLPLAGFSFLLISACTVGPDYKKPSSVVPVGFKELQSPSSDTKIPDKWWELFKDAYLNTLEAEVSIGNQSLAQAVAQYAQAQTLVQGAKAAYFPTATGTMTSNRFRAASGQSVAVSGVKNLFGAALSAVWEPDLWGGVRRQVEANEAGAQVSAATLQALRLSTHATLAQNYFQLRALDAQKKILDDTIVAYQKILKINQNRYEAGVAAKSELVQAQTQLESARSQAINTLIMRAKLEHAIAVLMGKAPATLTIPVEPLVTKPPLIPITIPSELLKRRPDIVAAERQVAAANAQIGVAKAAYFPSLSLSASKGTQARDLSSLFTTAARYWALGPAALALPLFDGGSRSATLEGAINAFDASVAAYRQSVLLGFEEVEDNLSTLRILEQQIQTQNKAMESAQAAVALSLNQYKAGMVNYLNVMVDQSVALQSEKITVDLQAQQLDASILLIKALGGGWDYAKLPGKDEVGGKIKWSQFLPIPVN